MNYWEIDANNIKLSDNWNSIPFIKNEPVQKFLDNKEKFFVVASKGLGKTLAIKHKSKMFRDNNVFSYFYPKTELCEKVGKTDHQTSFSAEDLDKFREKPQWSAIWEICILTVIFQLLNEELPEELSLIIGKANRITDILNCILSNRSEFYKISSLIPKILKPKLAEIDKSIAIFIDNVDEALEQHVGYDLLSKIDTGTVSEEVWINAQLGLIDAVKDLHFSNSHIKIYASLRIEAINRSKSSTDLQLETYISKLSYSKKNLRSIFEKNIELMPKDKLTSKNANTEIEKFIGFNKYEHKYASVAGTPIQEDSFDYIYRHTFGRPRELVLVGKKLYEEDSTMRKKKKIFKKIVNQCGTDFMEQYKKEIVPYFNDYYYSVFCSSIHSNILTSEEVNTISMKIAEDYGIEHIFCYFYNLGLIGYVSKSTDGTLIQKFNSVGEKVFAGDNTLPSSVFYIIHPALENDLRKSNRNFKIERYNVIGNEQIFTTPEVAKWESYHVHFGAGKLGLGLVAPLVNANSRLAIIQRPSSRWHNLPYNILKLYINHQEILSFHYISSKTTAKNISEIISQGHNILICSNRYNDLKPVLQRAKSLSSALGANLCDIEQTLSLVKFPEPINFYPFENSKKNIDKFTQNLRKINPDIEIVPLIADKICANSTRKRDSIYVKTEEYENVVIFGKNRRVFELFGNSETVKITEEIKEQEFYYKRKFWLVNGIHMIYAIYAYNKLVSLGATKKQREVQLLSLFKDDIEIQKYLDVFRKIQIIRLILTTDLITLRKVFGHSRIAGIFEELYLYSGDVMIRLVNIPDSLERILNPSKFKNFKAKYDQRIKELLDFISKEKESINKFIVLNEIDLSYDDIFTTTNSLYKSIVNIQFSTKIAE